MDSAAVEPIHALGPIEFDRQNVAYFATCRCGERFGPVLTAGMLHGAFDQHREARCHNREGIHTLPMNRGVNRVPFSGVAIRLAYLCPYVLGFLLEVHGRSICFHSLQHEKVANLTGRGKPNALSN